MRGLGPELPGVRMQVAGGTATSMDLGGVPGGVQQESTATCLDLGGLVRTP
jgi:hypothetical protein